MGRTFTYQNLTGGLNNVSSIGTINQSSRRTESPDMMNVEYFKLGGIKSMEGNIHIGNQQSHKVSGGFQYQKGNHRYMIITLSNGDVKIYNGVTEEFDLIYSFEHDTPRSSAVNINNGIVITNGIDDMIFYEKSRDILVDGTVNSTLNSDIITGTNTTFTKSLSVGDQIVLGTNKYFIKSIESDTSLTIETNSLETYSGDTRIGELSKCNAYLVNSDDANIHTPIRGLAIQYFKGRLWVGDGNSLYYSELGKYNGWDIKYFAGVISSIYNDTSDIKALGLYSSYMIIHKEYYSYILSGGDSPSDWSVDPYSSISCDSQQSFVVSNSKYFVFSKKDMGVYPLTQITLFNDKYVGDEISVSIRDLFTQLYIDKADEIFAVKLPRKRYMMMYMPNYYTLGSSLAIVFDFQTRSWLLRKVPQNVTIVFEFDNEVYLGTNDGKVLREFVGDTFDGEFLDAYWKSPWFDFGADLYYKSIDEFAIQMAEDTSNRFTLRTYRDGETNYKERDLTSDAPDLKALVFDGEIDDPNNFTNWDENDWAKSGFRTLRLLLENNFFQNYQIEICTKKLGDTFSIYGFDFRGVELEEVAR